MPTPLPRASYRSMTRADFGMHVAQCFAPRVLVLKYQICEFDISFTGYETTLTDDNLGAERQLTLTLD